MAPGAEDITEGLQEAGWTAACLHKVFNVASSNIDFFFTTVSSDEALKKPPGQGETAAVTNISFSDR